MEAPKLNLEYTYSYVEEYAEITCFEFTELGDEIVGEHFLLVQDAITTMSFILTGTRGSHYIYKRIY